MTENSFVGNALIFLEKRSINLINPGTVHFNRPIYMYIRAWETFGPEIGPEIVTTVRIITSRNLIFHPVYYPETIVAV